MYNITQLWQRYYFNRDIGDINRANYWLKRIEEYENINKKDIKKVDLNTKKQTLWLFYSKRPKNTTIL